MWELKDNWYSGILQHFIAILKMGVDPSLLKRCWNRLAGRIVQKGGILGIE